MKQKIIGAVLLAIAMVFASGETLVNAAIAMPCLVAGVCVLKGAMASEETTMKNEESGSGYRAAA